jgi:hypothetical protein
MRESIDVPAPEGPRARPPRDSAPTRAAPPESASVRPIAEILVGTRHRKHMGDIEALAASIAKNGLIHPVAIRRDGTLIAGERRIEAARLLGQTTIAVNVIDPTDLLGAEIAENTVRLDFAPSEAVAIANELRPIVEARAKERQGGRGRDRSGKLPERSNAQTRDRLAAAVGMSGRTLDKAIAVVAAAEAEPEMGDLVSKMDEDRKVDAAYQELNRRQRAARVATSTVSDPTKGQPVRDSKPPAPLDEADGPGPGGDRVVQIVTFGVAEQDDGTVVISLASGEEFWSPDVDLRLTEDDALELQAALGKAAQIVSGSNPQRFIRLSILNPATNGSELLVRPIQKSE